MAPVPNTSVDQIFQALHYLAGAEEPVAAADIARAMGLAMSTAHRLLVTLQQSGFAERDSTGVRYELGARAYQLVHGLFRQFGVRQASLPVLRRLSELTGETAVLDVRVGWHSVRMAGVEGWREVHPGTSLGRMVPLAGSAPGRAILSTLDAGQAHRYWRWHEAHSHPVPVSADIRKTAVGDGRVSLTIEPGDDGQYHTLTHVITHEGLPLAALSLQGTGPLLDPEVDPGALRDVTGILVELAESVSERPDCRRDPFALLDPDAPNGPAVFLSE